MAESYDRLLGRTYELEGKNATANKRIEELEAEIERLRSIVDSAWEVRREEKDYNPCPDLVLRAVARGRLYGLLDSWKAASSAKAAEEKIQ